jgi:divalent metal cation (Fe/Co/Zn/Cd) transporter
MRSLLIGEAASQAEVAAIGAALIDGPAVRRLIHLRTLHLGPDELLVGAKVEFDRCCRWSSRRGDR